jgi:hypothetical protein
MLFSVAQVFAVRGRGLVLHPATALEPGLHVGEPLELRRPDGTRTTSRIAGIEMLCSPPKPCIAAVVLPPEVSSHDVPVGTEVWRAAEPASG